MSGGGAVQRWRDGLTGREGLPAAEVERRHEALLAFCARHDTDPETLLVTWQRYPQLMVRRRPVAGLEPDLAVESFLLHNGVRVFDDGAGRGEQFVPYVT